MAQAECGCRVEIRDDELHIWPCGTSNSEQHYAALLAAARETGDRYRILVEERDQ